MSSKTLVVLGSGPGIGVGVASRFAVSGFSHIALVARNAKRLAEDEDKVLSAIQKRGYSCQVKTWTCDLTDSTQLHKTLEAVQGFGQLECVLYNAARVAGRPPLEETLDNIESDFRLTNLALYETAQWAMKQFEATTSTTHSPSFFVTSTTMLYKEPLPDLVSLSMSKTAQRALVLSINSKYKDVHVALLSIGGVVSPEARNLNPANIAAHAWRLYSQPRGKWQREEEVHE